jgi:hypothetical protein
MTFNTLEEIFSTIKLAPTALKQFLAGEDFFIYVAAIYLNFCDWGNAQLNNYSTVVLKLKPSLTSQLILAKSDKVSLCIRSTVDSAKNDYLLLKMSL